MALRLVQVSDTHLSPTHGYFAQNWLAFRHAMRDAPPDLLVHSGDIAFNGPVAPDDIEYGAAQLRALGLPFLAIPGNHDTGEAPGFSRLNQPVNQARIKAWRDHVGPNWWLHDAGDWRLVGIDTSLLASDLSEEAEQDAFLAEALARRGGRPVMLFMHMPPFDGDPDDPKPTTACVSHAARLRLLHACRQGGVKVIACGHLHVYRHVVWQGIDIVWAPATAMVDVRRWQERLGVFPRPGYLEWTLQGRDARHRLVQSPRMFVIDMTGWTALSGGTVTTLPPLQG
jgi:3',5'-cyclic AMP phosphodiesterase CpdA